MPARLWKRKAVWIPALVLVGLFAAGAVVVLPALPAIRFLQGLEDPEPTQAAFGAVARRWVGTATLASGERVEFR